MRDLLGAGCLAFAMLIAPLPGEARPTHTAKQTATESTKPARGAKQATKTRKGKASFYHRTFAGKRTASGQRYDPKKLTAAHRTLPIGTKAKVTNLENGKTVTVTINDRGPYRGGRIIDLSRAAAQRLEMVSDGVADVAVQPLD